MQAHEAIKPAQPQRETIWRQLGWQAGHRRPIKQYMLLIVVGLKEFLDIMGGLPPISVPSQELHEKIRGWRETLNLKQEVPFIWLFFRVKLIGRWLQFHNYHSKGELFSCECSISQKGLNRFSQHLVGRWIWTWGRTDFISVAIQIWARESF